MEQVSGGTPDGVAHRKLALHTEDDGELVVAARRGDDRAFGQLYERYRPRIHAFAVRMTHDRDRADDLVQEVFISALRRLRQTDTPIAFRPWIYEIARNACIDDHRRRHRITEVPLERDGVDGWLEHLAAGPSPEAAAEARQQFEDLRDAFRGLSERHHRVIISREFEGKSYRRIGDELGMSQAVVESTLFRARRRLGEEFQELRSGRRCERVRTIIGTAEGRRLGVREQRTVFRHLEHCRPCRHEALAAGFSLRPRDTHPLHRAAAAIFPVPLVGLLRRGSAVVHARVLATSAAVGRLGQSGGSPALGRSVAAFAAVAAGVGGGLLSQPSPAPAHAGRPAPQAAAAVVMKRGAARLAVNDHPGSSIRPSRPRRAAAKRTSARTTTTRSVSRSVAPVSQVVAPAPSPVSSPASHPATSPAAAGPTSSDVSTAVKRTVDGAAATVPALGSTLHAVTPLVNGVHAALTQSSAGI